MGSRKAISLGKISKSILANAFYRMDMPPAERRSVYVVI